MRIVIAYPPLKSEKGVPLLTQNRQFQWFSRPTYIFPVVPATAATLLKAAGHEVLFLDGIAAELTEAEFEAQLEAFKPDYIVLETKTPVVKRHWAWMEEKVRSKGEEGRSKFILVGDHVTALPEESINKPGVWAIIPGGDWDFGLLDFLKGDQHSGIYPFALKESLKDVPRIDRELVHWRLYSKRNGNFKRTPGTYIMAGRDCWHAKCTFCSWTTLYPRYRVREVKDVIGEIEYLVNELGVKEIMDDSGTFPVGGWLKEFCEEMIRRGLNRKVRLDCNMRFGRLTADDYRLMRKAGFRLVLFGVESANQNTLDRFCKALKVEDIEQGAKWASEAGLAVHLTFMFGHAWEGKDEIANTVRLARKMLAKGYAATLQCTLTVPYPGTPLFKELKANDGLNTLDWDEYDMRRAITKTPLVSEADIKGAVREVYRGFLQPMAILHMIKRNLFDFSFYYRGVRHLLGHLLDFKSIALALMMLPLSGIAEVKCPIAGDFRYEPNFSDEFNGSGLDGDKWMNGCPTFKGRKGVFAFASNNAAIKSGELVLSARKEAKGDYTMALVKAKQKSLYGYYECRAKTMSACVCNAFWLYDPLSDRPEAKFSKGDFSEEIDIFEIFSGKLYSTVHRLNTPYLEAVINSSACKLENKFRLYQPGYDFAQDYHVYGFLWTDKELAWFCDGKEIFRRKNDYFHRPLHVVFDCEIMKDWAGWPKDEDLPAEFKVDYFRYWSLPNIPSRLRPLMGWSSWNNFRVNISEEIILDVANCVATNGLKKAGYRYINIDDGFFGGRDEHGVLKFHPTRFPNGLKPVVDGIHALGLKAGIYSDAGADTCGSLYDKDVMGVGSGLFGHDQADCDLFFKTLGFDFIKIDYCGGKKLGLEEEQRYRAIRAAIDRTGRTDVRMNICRWQYPGDWAAEIAESWRVTTDIHANWKSVKKIIEESIPQSSHLRLGHYNDMDMLELGVVEGKRHLSLIEETTHFGMWCFLSSPLLLGCDPRTLPEDTFKLVTNPDLLAMNQNDLAAPIRCVRHVGETYILTKDREELGGKKRYVALYNGGDKEAVFQLDLFALDLSGTVSAYDLVARKDIGEIKKWRRFTLPPHGSMFLSL